MQNRTVNLNFLWSGGAHALSYAFSADSEGWRLCGCVNIVFRPVWMVQVATAQVRSYYHSYHSCWVDQGRRVSCYPSGVKTTPFSNVTDSKWNSFFAKCRKFTPDTVGRRNMSSLKMRGSVSDRFAMKLLLWVQYTMTSWNQTSDKAGSYANGSWSESFIDASMHFGGV